MKRRLIALVLAVLAVGACVDDVDQIAQDPNCVHIDFSGDNGNFRTDQNKPLDGIYCRRTMAP